MKITVNVSDVDLQSVVGQMYNPDTEVTAALSGTIQITNSYGEARGGTTTLREIIANEAKGIFAVRSGRFDNESVIQKLLRTEISSVLSKELSDAIAQEKDKIFKVLHSKTAELLGDAIKAALR